MCNLSLKKKVKIVFVGSFREATEDGSTGGQMFACRSLIKSDLSRWIDFAQIDSTSRSVPPPPVFTRLHSAIKRVISFCFIILAKNVDGALIFTSAGLSFIEKGMMVFLSKLFYKYTIFVPRSGLILDNCENSRIMKWYVKVVLRKADVIVCQSQYWKRYYRKFTSDSGVRYKVIPNWIDVNTYIRNTPNYVYVNPNTALNILYLGRFEEYKGILDLIEALYQIRDDLNHRIQVFICGGGSLLEKVRQNVLSYSLTDVVHLLGWVDYETKLHILRKTAIFVLPSHREGFPNALLEAMASGIPSIATRVGSIPEIIQNNHNGLLISPQKPLDIAVALQDLIANPQKRIELSSRARETVISRYSLLSASRKFRKLLCVNETNFSAVQ